MWRFSGFGDLTVTVQEEPEELQKKSEKNSEPRRYPTAERIGAAPFIAKFECAVGKRLKRINLRDREMQSA